MNSRTNKTKISFSASSGNDAINKSSAHITDVGHQTLALKPLDMQLGSCQRQNMEELVKNGNPEQNLSSGEDLAEFPADGSREAVSRNPHCLVMKNRIAKRIFEEKERLSLGFSLDSTPDNANNFPNVWLYRLSLREAKNSRIPPAILRRLGRAGGRERIYCIKCYRLISGEDVLSHLAAHDPPAQDFVVVKDRSEAYLMKVPLLACSICHAHNFPGNTLSWHLKNAHAPRQARKLQLYSPRLQKKYRCDECPGKFALKMMLWHHKKWRHHHNCPR